MLRKALATRKYAGGKTSFQCKLPYKNGSKASHNIYTVLSLQPVYNYPATEQEQQYCLAYYLHSRGSTTSLQLSCYGTRRAVKLCL